jgi:hypothetical protein
VMHGEDTMEQAGGCKKFHYIKELLAINLIII